MSNVSSATSVTTRVLFLELRVSSFEEGECHVQARDRQARTSYCAIPEDMGQQDFFLLLVCFPW